MNKIVCGNAVDELKKIEDDSVGLVITSPPYWDQREYSDNEEEIGHEPNESYYIYALTDVFRECFRICKPTGSIVFNIGDTYKNQSLKLVPYRFALHVLDHFNRTDLKLVNEITWVKTNPTPRQYKKRLISSTEPFFHFAKTKDYYYNRDAFLDEDKTFLKPSSSRKGSKYLDLLKKSDLSEDEQAKAINDLIKVRRELSEGNITDFRMKIRGMHKKAFGGQQGGRNSQIEKQGYTIIRMYGKKLKRDVIENSVANTKDIDHPAVFPLKVIMELIKLLSVENDIVVDPFCGSGQVWIDLKQEYCDIARDRVSKVESEI
jgi:site-specific DNA-methyltransferase (adenine-specific)